MVIALVFALGSLSRSYLVKVLLSSTAILAVTIGTWWIHINYAPSSVELTPIFRYYYDWSLSQVSLTALGAALPIGIFGNLVHLAVKDG
jgi:hypothetical protein